ncbi:MAG: hypothetical protein ACTSYA_02230 [Candidatus Kariarchaeaceae archaeon]
MNLKNINQLIFTVLAVSILILSQSIASENTDKNTFYLSQTEAIVADHSIANLVRLDLVPEEAILAAKASLHIAYGHTSHGTQLTTGMSGLPEFKENDGGTLGLYNWSSTGNDGTLHLVEPFSGDLGNPNFTSWADSTSTYLDSHPECNVIIWSWCGQVGGATEENINTYLSLMNSLEGSYSDVMFVYMTGHTDGTGLDGTLHIRNSQIRDYCLANDKILYDFEDIESYDPDGNYYGDKYVTDSCNWNNDTHSGNWALDWQEANTGEWYDCSSAHSQALNANLKAYSAWWLWARLAGWQGVNGTDPTVSEMGNTSYASITLVFGVVAIITIKRKKN